MSDVLRHLKLWDVKSGSESDIANYIFPGSQYDVRYTIYIIYIHVYVYVIFFIPTFNR